MLELRDGDKIGGFIVKGRLGKGGMGEVYLVRDPRLAVDRALKVIALKREAEGRKLNTNESHEFRERFLREARTLARLRHPSIITVHHVDEHVIHGPGGKEDRHPFLVMSHFPSKDARMWLHEDQPQFDEVKQVAEQLAGALAYAHGRRVLHRDIKLSNVLIQSQEMLEEAEAAEVEESDEEAGDDDAVLAKAFATHEQNVAAGRPGALHLQAMLIDFGLAKSSSDPDLTGTGRNMGTYSYMAPEYVAASVTGARARHTELTDLWALGCVLYGLTCQRLPFQGADDLSLVKRIQLGEFPSVASLRSDASPEWIQIIEDLMQLDPTKRTPSALELVRRLALVESPLDEKKPAFLPPFDPGEDHAASDAKPAREKKEVSIFASEPKLNLDAVRQGDDLPALDDVDGVSRVAQPAKASGAGAAKGSRSSHVVLSDEPKLVRVVAPQEVARAEPPPTPSSIVGGVAGRLEQADADSASAQSAVSSFRAPAPRAASTSKSTAMRKLALPLAAALAVVIGGGSLILFTGSAHADAEKTDRREYVDPEVLRLRERSTDEIEALERERSARASLPVPLAAPPLRAAGESSPAVVSVQQPAPLPKRARAASAAPKNDELDAFAQRYGSRTDFNVSSGPPQRAATAAASTASARAGVKIPVRVADAIVSSPTGPVIAVVTQATKVGTITLPAGAQIHGQTAGTSGSRVLVSFSFAIVDGQNVPLQGTALGLDGRAGVPGTKSLGGVTDVAAGGATGGAQGAVDSIARAIDNTVIGGVVRGAGSPGAQKLTRINNEEEVVSTTRTARFFVYIGSD